MYNEETRQRLRKKIAAWLTLASFMLQIPATALADPQTHTAANGVPIVEIEKPSAAGVSRNEFDRFNVDNRGLIFNNAGAIVQTQLGGYIMGNANIGDRPARVILAEVVGRTPSSLNGYMEIAGRRADLIIANPNGIVGSGFGFINTSRAVLTTGQAVFGASGSLDGFRVDGGTVRVEGAGLDASTADKVEILARAAEINAGIWAKELEIVTGANEIAAGQVRTLAPKNAPQSAVALDVGALGGMYAGKIRLIGTEKGLGVNSLGTLQSTGDFILTSQGKISLGGDTVAAGNLRVESSASIENRKTLAAGQRLEIEAGTSALNSGQIVARQTLAVDAKEEIANTGTVYADKTATLTADRIKNTNGGAVSSGGDLALSARNIVSDGTLQAGVGEDGALSEAGNLAIHAQESMALHGKQIAAANAELDANEIDLQRATILARKSITVDGKASIIADAAQIAANESLAMRTETLGNREGKMEAQKIALETDRIDNTGGSIAGDAVRIDATNLYNGEKGEILHYGKSALDIVADSEFTNAGFIGSNGNLNLHADSLKNTTGRISAARDMEITARQAENEAEGVLLSGGKLALTASESIANRGTVAAAGDLALAARNIASSGRIETAGRAALNIGAVLDNTSGTIVANEALSLRSSTLENTAGTIAGGVAELHAGELNNGEQGRILQLGEGAMTVSVTRKLNNMGLIASGGDLSLSAQSMVSDGTLQAGVRSDGTLGETGSLAIRAEESMALHGKQIAAVNAELDANEIDLQHATILTGKSIAVDGKTSIIADAAQIAANESLTMRTEMLNNREGKMEAQKIALEADRIDNTGGSIAGDAVWIATQDLHNGEKGEILHYGSNALNIAVQGELTNAGLIGSNGKLNLHADTLKNTAGTIAGDAVKLHMGELNNGEQGRILQLGEGAMTVSATGQLNNMGLIASGGGLALSARNIVSDGTLQAGVREDGTLGETGSLAIRAEESMALHGKQIVAANAELAANEIDLQNATILTGKNIVVDSKTSIVADAAQIAANESLTMRTEMLSNREGQIEAQKIALETDYLSNMGSIAGDAVRIDTTTLYNGEKGEILQFGQGALDIAAEGELTNAGHIGSNGRLNLHANILKNTTGRISAASDLEITVRHAENDAEGVLLSGGKLALTANESIANSGTVAAAGDLALTATNISSSGRIETAGRAALNIGAVLDNASGTIVANEALSLQGGRLENTAGTIAGDTVRIAAKELHNGEQGQIVQLGQQDMEIAVQGELSNTGFIGGNGSVNIDAGTLKNTAGRVSAGGDLAVAARQIENTANGVFLSGGDLNLTAAQSIVNRGTVAAEKNLAMQGKDIDLENASVLAGKNLAIAGDSSVNTARAKIAANGALEIAAQNFVNQGGQIEAEQVTINAGHIDNTQGKILHYGAADFKLESQTLDNTNGQIAAGAEQFALSSETLKNAGGSIEAAGRAALHIDGVLDNASGSIIANDVLSLKSGALENTAGTIAGDAVELHADTLNNGAEGRILHLGEGAMKISATDTLTNTGQIGGNGAVNLSAGTLVNTAGQISAAEDLNIAARQVENGADGALFGGGNLAIVAQETAAIGGKAIAAGNLEIRGKDIQLAGAAVFAGNDLAIAGEASVNADAAQLAANRAIHIDTTVLSNRGGLIESGGALSLAARNMDNRGGIVQAAGIGALQIADKLDNTGGAIAAGQTLTIRGGAIENTAGSIEANTVRIGADSLHNGEKGQIANFGQTEMRLNIAGDLTNLGSIGGNGSARIAADNLQNNAGQISAQGDLFLTARQIASAKNAALASGGSLAVNARETAVLAGQNTAAKDLAIHAANVDLRNSVTTAGNDLTISSADTVRTGAAQIAAGGALKIEGKTLENQNGQVEADNVLLNLERIDNTRGTILHTGAADFHLATGVLNNTQGLIAANAKDFKLAASELTNAGGEIAHAGNGEADIAVQGAFNNRAGRIVTNGDLALRTDKLDNTQGTVAAERTLAFAAQTADNTGGLLQAKQGMKIDTQNLHNGIGGQIVNLGGVLDLTARQALANDGAIASGGDLRLTGGEITNRGQLSAQTDLSVRADKLRNENGILYTGRDLTVDLAQTLDNSGTLQSGHDLTIAAQSVRSDGTLAAGIGGDGQIANSGKLSINARQIAATGQNLAADIKLQGGEIDLSGSDTYAKGNLALISEGGIGNAGGKIAAGALTMAGQSLDNTNGSILQTGAARTKIAVTGAIDNTGGSIATNGAAFELTGGALQNAGGTVLHAGTNKLDVKIAGTVDNTRGNIRTNGELHSQSQTLDNAGGQIGALGALSLETRGDLRNGNGSIVGNDKANIHAANIENKTGGTLTARDLQISANQSLGNSGAILGTDGLAVTAGNLQNEGSVASGSDAQIAAKNLHNGGSLSAQRDLAVQAQIVNNQGAINAGRDIDVETKQGYAQSGSLVAGRDARLHAGQIDITGTIGAGIAADGTLQDGGALSIDADGAAKLHGNVVAAGNLELSAQTVDNVGGKMTAGNLDLKANRLDNSRGQILTYQNGTDRLQIAGDFGNVDGIVALSGETTQLRARAIDNTGGQIAHSGTGSLSLTADQTLGNQQGNIQSNGALQIKTPNLSNNDGKIVAQNIVLQGANLNVDNTTGEIAAASDLTLTANRLQNAGGSLMAGKTLKLETPTLDKGGVIQAGDRLAISLQGDYTQEKGSSFTAGGSLALTTTGTITNEGTIGAVKDLGLTARDIANTTTGTLTAGGTLDLRAQNAIDNAGRIDANHMELSANHVQNTGSIIGGSLTVTADTMTNSGANAITATTGDTNLLIRGELNNADHANIYSLGSIAIAADTDGNKTGKVINQSATIEAGKDIYIAASELTNKRTVFETEMKEVSREEKSEQISHDSHNIGLGPDTYDVYKNYTEIIQESVIKKDSGVARIIAGNNIVMQGDQITNYISEIIAGNVLSIVSANNVDNISSNVRRTVERKNVRINTYYSYWTVGGCTTGCGGTQYEVTDTYINDAPDEIEQGETIAGYSAILQGNQSVQISAKNINNTAIDDDGHSVDFKAYHGPDRNAAEAGNNRYDAGTGQKASGADAVQTSGKGQANLAPDTPQSQTSAADARQQSQPSTSDLDLNAKSQTDAPNLGDLSSQADAIHRETVGGASASEAERLTHSAPGADTSAAGSSLIEGKRPEGEWVAGANTGQSALAGNTNTVDIGKYADKTSAGQGDSELAAGANTGNSALAGHTNTVDIKKYTDQTATGGANTGESTLAGSTNAVDLGKYANQAQIPGLDLNHLSPSGLFHLRPEPSSRYLVETDRRFTDYKNFISSDYLLEQVDYEPDKTLKRLGDGLYEQQLVRDQIEAQTGRSFLNGYTDNEEQYKQLLNSGAKVAQDFHLTLGVALTPEQINALTEDIVWLEERQVQGQTVLVPVVYLAQGSKKELQPTGAIVAGKQVTLTAEQNIANTGSILGDQTRLAGTDIVNRGGTIGGTETLDIRATRDIVNKSGDIVGGQIGLTAGRDIVNERVVVNAPNGQKSSLVGNEAQIAGSGNVNLAAGRDILNSGASLAGHGVQLAAGNDVKISAVEAHTGNIFSDQTDQLTSRVTSQDGLGIAADRDLTLQSAGLGAIGNIDLQAGRDLGIEAAAQTKNQTTAGIYLGKINQTNSTTHISTTIDAGGNISAIAGGDLAIRAGKLDAQKDIALQAGGTFIADTAVNQDGSYKSYQGYYRSEQSKTNITTDLAAGGSVHIASGGDLTLKGTKVAAGDNIAIGSGGNIAIGAVQDEAQMDRKDRIKGGWEREKTLDETTVGTDLSATNSIVLKAGDSGSLKIEGSRAVSETGEIRLGAGKDIVIQDTTEKHERDYTSHTKKSGFFSSTTTDTHDYSLENRSIGSALSGDSIEIGAGQNIGVKGSDIVGTNDVNLVAGKNITLDSGITTGYEEHERKTKTSGIFSGGGLGITIGSRSESDATKEKILSNKATTIGSVDGSVTLKAGATIDATGSHILAGKDIAIEGKKVVIDNAVDTYDYERKYELKQTGLTVGLGGDIVNAGEKLAQGIERGSKVEDSRLKALYGYEATQNLKDLGKAMDGVTGNNLKDHLSVNISIGSSKTSIEQTVHAETVNPSDLKAGNNITITSGSDLSLKAVQIEGKDIALKAKDNLNIENAANQYESQTKQESSAWSLGYTIGGGITGSYGKGSNQENETAAAHMGSEIKAKNNLHIETGRDTDIIGSKLQGQTVEAEIGGNLRIESKQDEKTYNQSGKNIGIGIGIGGKNGGIQGSIGKNHIDSDYDSVTEQAGIHAGQGGFDIHVGKNTDLKGGVIASEASVDKNKLSTETLTYGNIENKAEYDAGSAGIGINTSKGAELNEKGITPNIGITAKDDASSTTKSAIAEGTIEIRGEQKQGLEGISRDTETALNKLGEIFDKTKVEEQQELAQKFGEHAYQAVHRLGNEMGWADGSPEKVALHAIVGGIMSKLGGGDIKSGITSAAINETIINEIGKIKAPALQQWVSYIIGSAVAEAIGGEGTSGGSVAASGTKNNRQDEIEMAKATAKTEAQKRGIEAAYQEGIYLKDGQGLRNAVLSLVDKGIIPDPEKMESDYVFVDASIGIGKFVTFGAGAILDKKGNVYIFGQGSVGAGISTPIISVDGGKGYIESNAKKDKDFSYVDAIDGGSTGAGGAAVVGTDISVSDGGIVSIEIACKTSMGTTISSRRQAHLLVNIYE